MNGKIGRDLSVARSILLNNGVVGIPTETVYGLAANALSQEAVLKVFEIKNRPKFDPLIVHGASLSQLSEFVHKIPEPLLRIAEKVWPGPLTIVTTKKELIPDLVTSGLDTVAIRVPQHSLTIELLKSLPFPLAAPSANPFTYVSPTRPEHVMHQLGSKVGYILDGGACSVGLESTILGYKNGHVQVLRLGGMSVEQIQSLAESPLQFPKSNENQSIPGNFKKHYSNGREMIDISDLEAVVPLSNEARLFYSKPQNPGPSDYWLTDSNNLNEAARNVFQRLRQLDQPNIDKIYFEKAPDEGLGRAINDRLNRASEKR